MILKVKPVKFFSGNIHLSASKSYSIRAFLIAACGGVSRIIRPSDCDDAKVAIAVARHLGAKVKQCSKTMWEVRVPKALSHSRARLKKINVKESGTVLRFLLPLVSLHHKKIHIVGEGTLKGRPNYHLTRVLRSKGVMIKGRGPEESIPIRLSGGSFKGGKIQIQGNLSSQFISALLITCPQVPENTVLTVKGSQVVSSEYITMTQQILAKSGIKIHKKSQRVYMIQGGQTFRGLKNFVVPSDYGLAAFPLAAAALVKSKVLLKGHLKNDLVQADGKILNLLRRMGVRYTKTAQTLKISGPFSLKGGAFSLKDCPDLVPIMSILALFAKGKTRLYDIKHARAKESDRISDLRGELLKIGAKVTERGNELVIYPQQEYRHNVLLNPHHDHRLAMAFCVLGLKVGVRVKDIGCTAKSYPGFVKDMNFLGKNR